MNLLRKQQWLVSAVLVAVVLGLGVLLTWLVVERMGIHGGAVAVSCLLLPALVALAFSGRLSEISAGGVTARFREAGKQPVKNLTVRAETWARAQKGSEGDLFSWIAAHADDYLRPVVLELQLRAPYDAFLLAKYLRMLSESFPRFAFVVVVDESGGHVCHVSAALMLRWAVQANLFDSHPTDPLAVRDRVTPFLFDITQGQTGKLRQTPGVRSETVTKTTALADALQMMTDAKDELLLVTDGIGRPYGILERAAATTELLLALAG